IRIDGDDADWTGEAPLLDPPDELHRDALALDITSLRVDHGPKSLYAAIEFEKAGFGDPVARDDDVSVSDRLSLYIEPQKPAYAPPQTIVIPVGKRTGGDGGDARWAAKGRLLEVAI